MHNTIQKTPKKSSSSASRRAASSRPRVSGRKIISSRKSLPTHHTRRSFSSSPTTCQSSITDLNETSAAEPSDTLSNKDISIDPFDPRCGVPRQFTQSHGNPNYLTTPIYYVNGSPHLGHLYTTLVSHVFSSWKRACGESAWVMSGTDEHGAKVQEAAELAGFEPQSTIEYCDKVSKTFETAWDNFGLQPDAFLRTTSSQHRESVIWMWKQLARNGYIYLGKHEGWYCKSDETFIPETQLIKNEQTGILTTISGHQVEWIEEENFKFRLSAFIEPLIEYYTTNSNAVYPISQRNNVLSILKGMEDISVSRLAKNLSWSIDVPNDVEYLDIESNTLHRGSDITQEQHKVYVWLDALNIYITGARDAAANRIKNESSIHSSSEGNTLSISDIEVQKLLHSTQPITNNVPASQHHLEHDLNYPSIYQQTSWFANHPQQIMNQHHAETYQSQLEPFWPPTAHIIGKDILKFHCVYWPAFLLGCGLPLPRQVLVHSHWTVNGQKMSKSLGNVVSPQNLIDDFGVENTKYILLRLGNLAVDSDFDFERAVATINSELADSIGNLAMRCTGQAVLPSGLYPVPFDTNVTKRDNSVNTTSNPLFDIHPHSHIPFFNMTQLNAQFSLDVSTAADHDLQQKVNALKIHFQTHMEEFRVDRALGSIVDVAHAANVYFSDHTPWKMAKELKNSDTAQSDDDKLPPEQYNQIKQRLNTILYHTIEAVRVSTTFLRLVIPDAADCILGQLSVPENARNISHARFGFHPALLNSSVSTQELEPVNTTARVSQVPFIKLVSPAERAKKLAAEENASKPKKNKQKKNKQPDVAASQQ